MCELCTQPDEKNVLIELRNIHLKTGAKYEAGIEAITKALGYDSERQQKEISPFRAVRELEEISKDRIEEGLLKVYDAIRSTWIRTEKATKDKPFVLNGRIFINPGTGKPLSTAQWKIIKKDVLAAFDYIYTYEEERIALHALALGKVIKGLPLDKKLTSSYKSLKPAVDDAMAKLTGPEWQDTVSFAQQEAAAMIVELKQKQYRQIHDTVQSAIKNRATTGKLTEDLYDKFGGMNRDWRRIAETEIGNAQNNGQLVTELGRRKPGEKYVFMKGISSAEACPWCRNEVDGKIAVLLESPPSDGGDKVSVDGETYTAIWPGKSNYGRNRASWWVAAGTQHPHCLLPDQVVEGAAIESVIKGFYKGRVIEVTTRSGNRLTVTENHPIFTPHGFVLAKFLGEGDYVVSSIDSQRMMREINPDYDQRPTAIEDLFTSGKHSSRVPTISVPTTPEDFHGDGRFLDGKVNVVSVDSFLRGDIERFRKQLPEQLFGGRDSASSIPFDVQGSSLELFDRGLAASSCTVGGTGQSVALLDSHSVHSRIHGRGSTAWSDTGFEKALTEGRSSHSKFSREFLLRFSREISVDNRFGEIGMHLNPSPLLVPDEIVHVRSLSYEGPVYDLSEAAYELYTCNDVIVKNCRCTWVKHIPGYEKWDDKFRQAMNQAREKGEHMRKPPKNFGEELKPNPF